MPARRKSGRARRTFSAGGVVYRQTAQGPEIAQETGLALRNWGATLDAALASLTHLEEAS